MKKLVVVIICVVSVLLFTIGVPLIINWLFTIPACCTFLMVDWEAKDALAYYGSVLGFIGTVIFSGLALWQNHIIKIESDDRAQIAKKMELKKHLPILSVKSTSCSGHGMNLTFGITNLSENVALDVVVSKIQILNNDGSEFWINEREHKYAHIGMDGVSIRLENPNLTNLEQVMIFRLSYKDKFGDYHTLLVEGKQMGTSLSFPKFYIKEM